MTVRLLDLKPDHCRWPLGATDGPDTLFCGEARDEPAPYCPEHCRIAYTPVGRRREYLPYFARAR